MLRTIIFLLISISAIGQPQYNYIDVAGRKLIIIPSEYGSISLNPKEAVYSGSDFTNATITDSLFLSTEKPVSLWEDNPLTLGMKFTTAEPGKITALKFYKTSTSTSTFIVSLWDNSWVKLSSVTVSTSATGWIRLPVNISVGAGTFTIGVYNPVGRYGYGGGFYPRTRGSITALNSVFDYGNNPPTRSATTNYFIDIVFQKTQVATLSVKASPDREVSMPKDSVQVSATATGYTSFAWTVEDSQGKYELKNTNTLNPYVVPLDSSGCRVWLMCTVTDINGNQLADVVAVRIAPHPKLVMGYVLYDGTIIYRIKPTWIELP